MRSGSMLHSVRIAEDQSRAQSLQDRVTFEVGDAATWPGMAAAAMCVGVSHAFGGPDPMLERLRVVVPKGTVVIGDAVWQSPPQSWCFETFGELPLGPESLAAQARQTGWKVVETDLSTLAEWDQFESGWVDGVRALGTREALNFADMRERDYQKYRGVLGFCWLVLETP